jgi:hypothetical protein
MALTEETLFASIGRKQTQIELDVGEYNNLLLVLSKVVSGEIPKEDVVVDLNARSWKIEKKEAQKEDLSDRE